MGKGRRKAVLFSFIPLGYICENLFAALDRSLKSDIKHLRQTGKEAEKYSNALGINQTMKQLRDHSRSLHSAAVRLLSRRGYGIAFPLHSIAFGIERVEYYAPAVPTLDEPWEDVPVYKSGLIVDFGMHFFCWAPQSSSQRFDDKLAQI